MIISLYLKGLSCFAILKLIISGTFAVSSMEIVDFGTVLVDDGAKAVGINDIDLIMKDKIDKFGLSRTVDSLYGIRPV